MNYIAFRHNYFNLYVTIVPYFHAFLIESISVVVPLPYPATILILIVATFGDHSRGKNAVLTLDKKLPPQ